jgi:hypothetical protein
VKADSALQSGAAISTISGLQTALDGKQASGSYAPATGIAPSAITGTAVITTDSRLSDSRSPLSHTHDDRYYTETEMNTLLAGKQASGSYAPASGISPSAISGTAVVSTDSRLSDARQPLTHSHSVATTTTAGFMSTADKTKLDGVATGAEQDARYSKSFVDVIKTNISLSDYGNWEGTTDTAVTEFRVSSSYYQSGDEPYTHEIPGIVMDGLRYGGTQNRSNPCIDIYNQNGATTAGNTNAFLRFIQAGGGTTGPVIGSITRNSAGSGVAYNTTSDYRIKTNIEPLTDAVARLLQIPVHRFNWLVDPDGEKVDGFLAHEAQAIVPESVTGTKDGEKTEEYEVTPAVRDENGEIVTPAVMGTRTVPDYQGIDQSKLVPLLVAAVQELSARVAVLESK